MILDSNDSCLSTQWLREGASSPDTHAEVHVSRALLCWVGLGHGPVVLGPLVLDDLKQR